MFSIPTASTDEDPPGASGRAGTVQDDCVWLASSATFVELAAVSGVLLGADPLAPEAPQEEPTHAAIPRQATILPPKTRRCRPLSGNCRGLSCRLRARRSCMGRSRESLTKTSPRTSGAVESIFRGRKSTRRRRRLCMSARSSEVRTRVTGVRGRPRAPGSGSGF